MQDGDFRPPARPMFLAVVGMVLVLVSTDLTSYLLDRPRAIVNSVATAEMFVQLRWAG